MPEYFEALTRDGTATISLTGKASNPFLLSYDQFNEKSFAVHGSIPDGEFTWLVIAERADVPHLQVEKPK